MHADIIKRLEGLTGPDREVDALIAAALRVGQNLPDWAKNWDGEWRPTIQGYVALMHSDNTPGPNFCSAHYTASLDADVALVKQRLPGWTWCAIDRPDTAIGYVHNNERAFMGISDRPNPQRIWCEDRHRLPQVALLIALFRALDARARQESER